MLSYLVLASTTDTPLPADALDRLTALPPDLRHEPERSVVWRSRAGTLAVGAWQTRAGLHGGSHWHLDQDGLTAFEGSLRPRTGWAGYAGWAFELARLLDEGATDLVGQGTVVRARADGTALVRQDDLGGGGLYVARHGSHWAISDVAEVAARWDERAPDADALDDLVRHGVVRGSRAVPIGVERLPAGASVRIGPDGPRIVTSDDVRPPADATDVLSAVASSVEAASAADAVHRFVDLHAGPGPLLVVGALLAAGVTDRFRYRAVGGRADREAAQALADVAGVHLEAGVAPAPAGAQQLHRWIRGRALGSGGQVVPPLTARAAPADGAVVVASSFAEVLLGTPADDLARRAEAEAAVVGAGLRLDPTQIPALAAFAEAGGTLDQLLAAMSLPREPSRPTTPSVVPDADQWRALAPLIEAELFGRGRNVVEGHLDLDALTDAVRWPEPPDAATATRLWGGLTAAVWATDRARERVGRRLPRVSTDVTRAPRRIVLVTGVTSTGLTELSGMRLPLDDLDHDALLGVPVDARVADLCNRLLLACEATVGALPTDLDDRMSAPAMAGFADAARALLERRGGAIADPRLGLTLPFWRTHVGEGRVVLVTERPLELVDRSPSGLPRERLIGWWLDVVTATLDVVDPDRLELVDPLDMADLSLAEGDVKTPFPDASGSAPGDELLLTAAVLDSLIREIEVEAARPLVRTVRRARAAVRGRADPPVPPGVPLHVLDDLWRDAADLRRRAGDLTGEHEGLSARVRELEAELEQLRSRRSVRLAARVSRMLGRGGDD